ncbi:hypothetical protein G9A89_002048 [Geosiphon pyriformis]|nr:hypothetical protein G9A89_002048 [Geosiphon pyriformis]
MENKEIKTAISESHDCDLCKVCQKSIKEDYNSCAACKFIFFKKFYKNFSSGNKVVDEIIKNPIYIPPNNEDDSEDTGSLNFYDWIPWEDMSNINECGRGGFGIIYNGIVTKGLMNSYSIKHHGSMEYTTKRWGTEGEGNKIAIKIMKNNEEVFKELIIQRAMFINTGHMLLDITSVYGITQNPETLEYGIVTDFAENGDMRKYLSTNFYSNNWVDKLTASWRIISGLEAIHSSGMVHRDLHSGNILQYYGNIVRIGDLGLCQPVNNEATTTEEEKKGIFGVIPYIPPEVIKGERFTMAGDIYSFSMLLWELATGKPPFHDRSHDRDLIFDISLNGVRPEITSPLIPPCIAEIIEKCWDANPKSRPTAKEVYNKLFALRNVAKSKTRSSEKIQFEESDKYIEEMVKNDTTTNYSIITTNIHPGAIYTSRVLTLQMNQFSKG